MSTRMGIAAPQPTRRGRVIAAAFAALLALVLPLLAPTAASAAGDGVLTISIEPVDVTTGAPQTWAGSTAAGVGTNLGYRISYSCSNADCLGSIVRVSAAPFDPTYGVWQHLTYQNWTAPFLGATISGDGPSGLTINLGDLAAGSVGSFQVNYTWSMIGSANPSTVRPAQFFPNGFPIVMSVTGESSTISNVPAATAAAVEWRSTIRDPALAISNPGSQDSDTNVTYSITMNSGCLPIRETAPKGDARFTCAKSYVVTQQLDPRAVFVSASNGGVYDPVAHTVTWTATPGPGVGEPAIGWHRAGNSNTHIPRTVVVNYPAEAFSPGGDDPDYCNFTQAVTTTVSMTMIYLGAGGMADDSNVRTISAPRTHNIACIEPFAKAIYNGKTSTFDGPARIGGVSPVAVQPAPDLNRHNWDISVGNQANVPGVAVIEDDLDVQGTRTDQIIAYASGTSTPWAEATIEWTLDDGSTGTSMGIATAPAGHWFTNMRVTSGSMPGPNQLSTGTAQTTFTVRAFYAVTADAPVGQNRSNTATATMTYPDSPGLAPVLLGDRTHSINFVAPFGRGTVTKSSTNSGTAGVIVPPSTGSATHYWSIVARNTGNVPAVAVIDEPDLGGHQARVTQITHTVSTNNTATGATVQYTLNTGATGTAAVPFTAPAGTWITAVHVTSSVIQPVNAVTSQNTTTSYYELRLVFAVTPDTESGLWTNTADVTLTYPGMGVADVALSATGSVSFGSADTRPRIAAQFVGTPVVEGGGLAVPGRDVTYAVRGTSSFIPTGETFTPQYVFVAPVNWVVRPGSASFVAGTVPPGVEFSYRTVTIAGVPRSVVVANWPVGTSFGANATWPTMTVAAQPTFAAAAGSSGVAAAWAGEASHDWTTTEAVYTGPVTDTTDIDADGVTTEGFATLNAAAVGVGATAGMTVIKEICFPDTGAPDGCDWISEPGALVGVDPDATDISYRVRIVNSGNTALTNIVAYDVLPYPGDVGTSSSLASTPRGSTFQELLSGIVASSGVTLAFSDSVNPCRAEVYPGGPAGCVEDWATGSAAEAGAQAIRATSTGSLAPGAEVSFQYDAEVVPGAAADAIACNSVAAKADQMGVPAEPLPVCATTQEADLQLEVPDRLPLQTGRPGILPFTVTNNGGSAFAPATVDVQIPAGMRVADLAPAGWSCSVDGGTQTGPLVLTCTAVTSGGGPRLLVADVPDALDITVVPTSGSTACVEGLVHGAMSDPVPGNNDAEACFVIAPGVPELLVTKDDGRTTVLRGDEYSYTITVANGLVSEPITGATITDTLPPGLEFVSASDGGAFASGVVTWTGIDLAAAGEPGPDGDDPSGAAGSSVTRTVTVRVATGATGTIENTAEATAIDPAGPGRTLTGEATDTDDLLLYSIEKTVNAPAEGVYDGDELTYTITLSNDGTAPFPGAAVRDVLDDLLDDAAYIPGSGTVAIGGGSPSPLADPSGGELSWSGTLPDSGTVVLSYRVTVGSGGDGDLTNTAFTSAADTCDPATGIADDDAPCATTTTRLGPLVSKNVQSLEQNDDGTWTILYGIDVTNRNDDAPVDYALSDELRFGAGIDADSATVTSGPAGVALEPWTGSGAVTGTVTLPAGATHEYLVTVVADAGDLAGTAAAECVDGVAGGFANRASIELPSGRLMDSESCAEPVEPTVTKTAVATTQNPDRSWTTVYTIGVSAPPGAPVGGLAYTLEDAFGLPAGVTVQQVTVAGPGGAAVDPSFDGVAQTALLTAADRVGPGATRSYTVTLVTDVPAGAVTGSALACAPAGTGGYANAVTLLSGESSVAIGEAAACTAIVAQPMPQITKTVTSSAIDGTTGDWTIGYEITVTNPDPAHATAYDLSDELGLGDGIAVVDAQVASSDATVSGAWDGDADPVVASGIELAGGATHTYQVTVVATPPSVIDDDNWADMDCRVDPGETGTGFRNVATLTSGALSAVAAGCESATDPSVVKTTTQPPVQDPLTGLWEVEYQITVTNRSTTTVPGGIPYTVSDTFGFPAGTTIDSVDVAGPGTLNPGFDGSTETMLATGSIGAAADEDTPARHVYTVTVVFDAAAALSAGARACDPAQGPGGLLNEAEITVGGRATADIACVDAPEAPVFGVAKEILSQQQLPDGTWSVLYRITIANPSPTIAGRYDVEDGFELGAGVSLVGTPTIVARPIEATIDPAWDGQANTALTEDVLLGGGATHRYTVSAVIDAGSVRGTDPAGDCVLGGGETGTGFRNTATIGTGGATRDATACATAHDPAIAKTVDGTQVLNADGSWTVRYVITVTNPSATVDLTYGMSDELDFPTGTTIDVATVTARAGGPATSGSWDGTADPIVVAAGTVLPAGASHVFDVVVTATLPAGQASVADGWANAATVSSGTGGVIESEATAVADIELPELRIVKTASAAGVIRIGDTVGYTVLVENVGAGDFTSTYPAEVWDDLAGLLDDATLGSVTVTPSTGALTTPANRIHWSGALASGQSILLAYAAVVTAAGDQSLDNVAFAGIPGTTPPVPDPCAGDGCSATSTALPGFLLEKTVSTGVVAAGDAVGYQIVYTNTGVVNVPNATFSDDLSDVLDDAVLDGAITAGSGAVTVTASGFTWDGPLAAGASVTVAYRVIVNSRLTGDHLLANQAVTDPTFATRWPGGVCPGGAPCSAPPRIVETETGVRALAFAKVADRTISTYGQTIGYTVTVTNIGAADYTTADPATIVDTLTAVLDDARYNGDAAASAGAVTFTTPELVWEGPLAAGQTVTFHYTVAVANTATGDGRLDNVIGIDGTNVAPRSLPVCDPTPVDNAQEHCVVGVQLSPLAFTGRPMSILPMLVGLLLLLGGAVMVLVRARRRTVRVRSGAHR